MHRSSGLGDHESVEVRDAATDRVGDIASPEGGAGGLLIDHLQGVMGEAVEV
jgi:hypothetical protein